MAGIDFRNLSRKACGLNLYIVPLGESVDDEILSMTFSEYGPLFSAQVARDENGVSKCYGFVHFCSVVDGLRAKNEMDKKEFFGVTIQVKIATKQRGKCYSDGSTKWASNWNVKYLDDTAERDSVSDIQSEYSDSMSETNETSNVSERMRKLFESQSFADVTFYPKNNRRVSISAHRAILAVGSPLFAKMLYDDQKVTVGEKLEVQISNLSFDAFTSIVKYLYTDEISFENDAVVQGILDGAKQFGIHSLVNKCKEYFENVELTSDNVCSKLQMSTSNKITPLKERCIEFIQNNTLSVIQSTDFKKSNSTTVRAICKLQSLNLRSEVDLLEAVMQWLYSQPCHERKSLLEPLLKCIRFLSLQVREMVDAVEKYPDLMTAEEGLSIIRFLNKPQKNPNFTSVPPWCNKNMQSRCFFKEDVRGSQTRLNVVDPDGKLVGKIVFPLVPDPGQGFVSILTSLLQMKCISGHHQIKAIRLSFVKPMSDKCRINNLFIKVHVSPSGFDTTENVQIVNSESVRVEFRKTIKVRQGDTLDIEAEAKNIEFYKFLQFDETYPMPTNPHFGVCISSSPKQGKLYFISEIEYGPQYGLPKFPPKKGKNKNTWQ